MSDIMVDPDDQIFVEVCSGVYCLSAERGRYRSSLTRNLPDRIRERIETEYEAILAMQNYITKDQVVEQTDPNGFFYPIAEAVATELEWKFLYKAYTGYLRRRGALEIFLELNEEWVEQAEGLFCPFCGGTRLIDRVCQSCELDMPFVVSSYHVSLRNAELTILDLRLIKEVWKHKELEKRFRWSSVILCQALYNLITRGKVAFVEEPYKYYIKHVVSH